MGRLRYAIHFVIMVGLFFIFSADRLRLDRWDIVPHFNTCFLEGYFWLQGHVDLQLPRRISDAAVFNSHLYNVFPPLFSIISAGVMGTAHLIGDEYIFPWTVYVILMLVPLLFAAFWAFYAVTGVAWRAVFLSLCLLLGTAVLPQLAECQIGGICQVNHILSQVGLLLIAGDCLGKRRVWPSLLGLVIAVWSRQLTIFYAPAIAFIMPRNKRTLISVAATVAITLGFMATLNALKFGSPLQTGYKYIYAGLNNPVAQRAAKGLFSLEFLPENFYYMNLSLPRIEKNSGNLTVIPDRWGTSIWLGSPILIYLFVCWRQWWADHRRRALVLATCPIIVMILLYHTTGYVQPGQYRFSLDFVPILLAVLAPYVWGKYRTPITSIMLIWSILYFRWASAGAGDWYWNAQKAKPSAHSESRMYSSQHLVDANVFDGSPRRSHNVNIRVERSPHARIGGPEDGDRG
jgi:hypothetical protein